MDWTVEQREAIEYGGENILLAAAAGSGKTAVLVERIVELICRKNDPVNINELLVLTFTDAAAREMREKISDAIEKTLDTNPKNQHLQKQRLLMHSASISTIHSFCMQILKNNIQMTDLPVNFSLVSETENKMLLASALDGVLERFYGKIEKDWSIADLVMGYGGIKNDHTLRELVISLLGFSKSMAHPSKWLNKATREFGIVAKTKSIDGTVWQKWICGQTDKIHFEIVDLYRDIQNEAELRLDEGHSYKAFFADEEANLKRIFEHIDKSNYELTRSALKNFAFGRLPSGTRNADGEVLNAQNKIKALRQLAKDCLADLLEIYKISEQDMVQRISKTYYVLRTLKNIVLICDRSYTKKKREKHYLDFSDLEHEALKLLETKNGGESPVVKGLQEKYREILIDEYQDTNYIQDTIFRTVSRQNKNIFMVGDLKQSIYTFRNAVPKLFLDKYIDYDEDGTEGHLIRLFKNFRSRQEVVDVVNFIFCSIMSHDIGDVDYTEEEYLIQGAQYPTKKNTQDYTPEFHFACSNADVEDGQAQLSKQELEAYIAAGRIRQMVDSKIEVFDKTTGKMRPIEYRDIVVLMRNTKALAPVFESIFEESNIPVYTEVGKSYLSSREVQTVLSVLQIADNPRQDIPLIAVMRSPIWGFTPEELAEMRVNKKDGCFFDAVLCSSEMGNQRATEFLDELEKMRDMAETNGVERLIWHIYYEYGYYAYSGAQIYGAQRQANLRLLFERAAEFEHTGLSGLFGFIAYIESIRSQGDDLAPSKILGDGDNVVRIMTVHKSKGLEFPVVILADTAHDFNMTDLSKSIIWNTEMGIGADYVDTKLRVRYPSLPRDVVAAKSKCELVSEEMRLLYVALTRAREKLIVLGTFRQTKTGMALPVYDNNGKVKPVYVRDKKCFRDWILAAILPHPDAKNLREYFGFEGSLRMTNPGFEIKTFVYADQNQIKIPDGQGQKSANQEVEDNPNLSEDIITRLDYEYPSGYLGKFPIKLSVSEAKRMQSEDEEYTPILKELKINDIRPLQHPQGAEKGTIVHFVLQLANPEEINSAEDIRAMTKRLAEEKTISEVQAMAVEPEKLFKFFDSEIGRRLKKAKRLEREFSFYTKANISDIYDVKHEGEILLQGTMDCFFEEENGNVVLLDFKTDRATDKKAAEVLSKKYKVQMKYYKKALQEILNCEVNECYLYFLDCNETIEV